VQRIVRDLESSGLVSLSRIGRRGTLVHFAMRQECADLGGNGGDAHGKGSHGKGDPEENPETGICGNGRNPYVEFRPGRWRVRYSVIDSGELERFRPGLDPDCGFRELDLRTGKTAAVSEKDPLCGKKLFQYCDSNGLNLFEIS
jgi:hypothetical protein